MIRQLASLTKAVTGWDADAIAVYGRADGLVWTPIPALDQGFEGVACVDDAARAVHLYSVLLRQGASAWARYAAVRLLRFVQLMGRSDGRFHNFLLDWHGTINRSGPTSYAGGAYWTARAVRAMVDGYMELGIPECRSLAMEAIYAAIGGEIESRLDAMATLVQATACLAESTRDPQLVTITCSGAELIADCRLGKALLDKPGETRTHLWAHEQEIALVRAARLLGRRSLVQLAADSAESVLRPPAENGFQSTSTCPYEVSCVARGLHEVGSQAGRDSLVEAAGLARDWFFGRNPARRAVYDAARGAFLDGINNARVSPDSGAESNIEGALCVLTVPSR